VIVRRTFVAAVLALPLADVTLDFWHADAEGNYDKQRRRTRAGRATSTSSCAGQALRS
jgi:protocatechuate 3,4-dioxygenase beta subunit